MGADFLVLALGPLQLGGECAVEMTAEKPQRLLAALALQPNRWVSTAELTEALWPEGAPASARGNLKTYVHLLRQLLPAVGEQQRIDSRKGSYRLVVSRDELDVTTFEDLIAAARTTLADGEAGLAADRAAAALRLWRGEPFESLSGHAAEIERVRLAELRHSAADCRADALLADGRADEAIALLRPLASADSLREASWERLMRALIQAGRPAEALRTYHELRTGLASELGTEPGPGPRRLYNQLLDADREAGDDVRMSPPAVVSPPVKRQWPGRRNLVIAACIVFVLLVAGGAYAFWPQPTPDQKLMQLVNSTDPIQKRPITMPPPGHLIFGMSNGVDDTSKSPLYQQAPLGMVTQYYYERSMLAQVLPGWSKNEIPKTYAAGKAIHLMVDSPHPNQDEPLPFSDKQGSFCGFRYPLSDDFLPDMRTLAMGFAGKKDGPPLFVSMFNGVDKHLCGEGVYDSPATTAYAQALKVRYLQAIRIFHAYAPNSRVGLDLDGWLLEGGDTNQGKNLVLVNYFSDVLKQSDFQTFSAFEHDGNIDSVTTMTRYLGRFGPVMVCRFAPDGSIPNFDSDLNTMMTPSFLKTVTAQGLFAWNFDDDTQFDSKKQPQQFAETLNAVRKFGASAAPA
ncbi:hypothetical protein GCM10009765_12470 [Fodinicola feengrottensis]|uniref:OmpR/PhoB-type domain-containing protein n=1 Tax=Fodinicola feengrottensis TaxID=435914 RepID=A0ABN2G327_9ACTN